MSPDSTLQSVTGVTQEHTLYESTNNQDSEKPAGASPRRVFQIFKKVDIVDLLMMETVLVQEENAAESCVMSAQ